MIALQWERGEERLSVKTKSIYQPAGAEDGVRVLITRHYPRGVKKDRFDRWVRALSPSRDLLSSYRSGEKTWDQFRESFLRELRSSQESLAALRTLRALSGAEGVTLLCYEREGLPCHRHIVKEILVRPRLLLPCAGCKAKGGTRPHRNGRSV